MRLMIQDEARFGRMSDPRACWAPAPNRPTVNRAIIREFRYEYAAISPWDGDLDYMTLARPRSDSPYIFLRASGPYSGLGADAIYDIVRSIVSKTGSLSSCKSRL